MKKVVSLLLVVVFVLAFSSVAFAMSEKGLESSPVFSPSGLGSYANDNNWDVRFDTVNHRMAVPGCGGANSNENSAIIPWHDASLVDPHDTL